MVISRQGQHTTKTRGACGIAVLEHVAAAIHTGPLAVPHREHAVVPGALEQIGLLTAPDHGGAQIFVDAGGEVNGGCSQMFACLPELEVEATQGAAAITGNETRGVVRLGTITHLLHQRQTHQRLHTTEIDPTRFAGVLVFQRVLQIKRGGGR